MNQRPGQIHDELLVLGAQDGEAEAFRELVGRWQRRLWRHAWRLTGRRDAASDVLQEAWIAIVRGIRKLDDPACFGAWAYRIVGHKCADWTRGRLRQRNLVESAAEDAVEAVDDPPSGGDEDEGVRQALARLPAEYRAVLSLRYLDGASTAEIANILGVPLGTVKSRLHYAKKQMKRVLERSVR